MNDFEKKLSERLDNPAVDPDTGVVLEAEEITGSYEAAQKKQLIPDHIYAAYVKYHGLDNALPHNELKTNELMIRGKWLPMGSWPTKTTRATSSAHWAAYNKQIQKPKPEVEISPCADPEGFVNQAMRDCMKVGRKAGRWSQQRASQKCGKQIDMLRQAVYDYCNGEGGEDFLRSLVQQMTDEGENPQTNTDMFGSIKDKLE